MNLIFLDFETYYDKDYSLSKMTTQSYIHDERFKVHGYGVALNKAQPQWVSGDKIQDNLIELSRNEAVWVCHNASFDISILEWRYGVRPKFVIDTLALSRAIIGGVLLKHSLDNVAELVLGERKGDYLANTKGVRNLSVEQEQKLAAYCLRDVDLTRKIFYRLMPYITKHELKVANWVTRAFTQPKLRLNTDVLQKHYDETVEKKAKALEKAGLTDRDMLMSNPKFAATLEMFGVCPPRKISKTTGKETFAFAKTDEGLRALLEHENVEVQALVAARLELKSTIEETRSLAFLKAATFGAWPVDYKFSGAMQTHRLSGSSGNPQNLTRGGALRRAIEAPDGYILVVSDLSQIELRICMALAGEKEEIDALRRGEDPYTSFAKVIYEKDDISEMERQVAKAARLGLQFGMGPPRFLEHCKEYRTPMTAELAERIVYLYRDTYPGIPKLWKKMDRVLQVLSEGEEGECPDIMVGIDPLWIGKAPITNAPGMRGPSGLWITYPNLSWNRWTVNYFDKDLKQWVEEEKRGFRFGMKQRTAVWGGFCTENIVQHLARCAMMEHLLDVDKHYPVVMSTHDEIIALVSELEKDEAVAFVKGVMSTPPLWWPELPIATKIKSASKSYGDAK